MSLATAPRGSAVEEILQRGGPPLRELMGRVEARLAAVARDSAGALAGHAAATIAAGGKRLRPLLVFLAADAVRAKPDPDGDQALVRAAVAVELVHSATLVHDDVLDAADLRRGHPTVVATGGRALATAAGDLLFSRAFAELALNGCAEQLRTLSNATSALAVGELLQREDAYGGAIDVERYLLRCELKTARLFEAACRLGALAVGEGAGGEVDALAASGAEGLGAYARDMGLAFQLLDDVLDVSGPASRTGKQRGADLLDGTVTLPLILARGRDPQLAELDLRSLRGHAEAEAVCDRIAATGALQDARGQARELVDQAQARLPATLPQGRVGLLARLADAVVERYS